MDLYLELFGPTPMERVVLPGGQTEGMIENPNFELETMEPQLPKRENQKNDRQYVHKYRQQEEQQAFAAAKTEQEPGPSSGYDMERLTGTAGSRAPVIDPDEENRLKAVYSNYNFECRRGAQSQLAISSMQSHIGKMIEAHQVVVLEGHTGCGKTTQVPQYILDHERRCGRHCNIVVTQPRRIAAMSVASRVSKEREWPLGSLVGFKVGLNEQTSEDTRVLYCTTGVLLQTLVSQGHAGRFTHLVLDEVHERDQEMDFLLLLVRRIMQTTSRHIKVVVMSATIDTSMFSDYFWSVVRGVKEPAPVIHVEPSARQSRHRLSIFYLDDLFELNINVKNDSEVPQVTAKHHEMLIRLVRVFDDLEQKERERDKEMGVKHPAKSPTPSRGTILIFLPGIFDISTLFNLLSPDSQRCQWTVLPLHSSITRDEQVRVFDPPAPGYRKIILSTNIAESSITVPDIKYVLDLCLSKQLCTDPSTNFSSLQLCWASKASLQQRAGRAGRVASGRVYRLITRQHFEKLEKETRPEMERCPLERLVLMCKTIDPHKKPKELLALAMSPPALSNINATIQMLKECGGLLLTAKGVEVSDDGDITFLGRVMARLPLDVRVSKMIVLGYAFGVLDDCIIMGAAMSVKNMFTSEFQGQMQAYHSKMCWANGSCSDPIAFRNAYKLWRDRRDQGYFDRTKTSSEADWARRYYLQVRALHEVCDLTEEIRRRLMHLGIQENHAPGEELWQEGEEPLISKLVLAGAFYPNYFVRATGSVEKEKDAVRLLVGRDPLNTVYLMGMPQGKGKPYTRRVRQMLQHLAPHVKVTFDDTKKAYVEFPKEGTSEEGGKQHGLRPEAWMPGRVSLAVYRAIKMRQLQQTPLELNILPSYREPPSKEREQAQIYSLATPNEQMGAMDARDRLRGRWGERTGSAVADPNLVQRAQSSVAESTPQVCRPGLPGLQTSHVRLHIIRVESPGRFWAYMVPGTADDQGGGLGAVNRSLDNILKAMNDSPSCPSPKLVPLQKPPSVGQLIAAPYEEDGCRLYYRARVVAQISPQKVQVYFVDYGNSEDVDVKSLLDFGSLFHLTVTKEFALECRLAELQPSVVHSAGLWSRKAVNFFKSKVERQGTFYAEVYSVVQSVVTVRLLTGTDMNQDFSKLLVKFKYAQPNSESLLSQENHALRESASTMTEYQLAAFEEGQFSHFCTEVTPEPEPPSEAESTITIPLLGPYSPLEMKVYHLIHSSTSKNVTVDNDSVNSVLIDDDPQEKCDRLLVAGQVTASSNGSRLTLRQTTLLPCLPGLPALVGLLFAPRAEIRVDRDYETITGALLGLGCDTQGQSHFAENDVEMTFDVKFNIEDLLDINRLRHWLNNLLVPADGEELPMSSPSDRKTFQLRIKHFLVKLLHETRERRVPMHYNRPFRWKQLNPEKLLVVSNRNANMDRAIFPMHVGVQLEREGKVQQDRLEANIRELEELGKKGAAVSDVRCLVCRTELNSLHELRHHLMSTEHLLPQQQLLPHLPKPFDLHHMEGAEEEEAEDMEEQAECGAEPVCESSGRYFRR